MRRGRPSRTHWSRPIPDLLLPCPEDFHQDPEGTDRNHQRFHGVPKGQTCHQLRGHPPPETRRQALLLRYGDHRCL